MPQGMPTDYREESLHIVAMKFPTTGKPSLLQSSYPAKQWNFMVLRAKLHPEIGAQFILDDTDEGQAILQSTDPVDLTIESLVGMEADLLLDMAGRYGIKSVSNKTKKQAVALKILAAIAEGVRPTLAPASAGSGV